MLELISVPFAEACLTSRFHPLLRTVWQLLYTTSGDTRNLLEVYDKLLGVVTKAAKSKTMLRTKAAAMTCLSALCSCQGRLLLGHLPDTVRALGKLISSSSEPDIRSAAVCTLGDIVTGCGNGGADSHMEALKFLKTAATDKASSVRILVGANLLHLVQGSSRLTSIAVDQCIVLCKRGLEDPVFSVKLAFADSFGRLVAHSVLQNVATAEQITEDKDMSDLSTVKR